MSGGQARAVENCRPLSKKGWHRPLVRCHFAFAMLCLQRTACRGASRLHALATHRRGLGLVANGAWLEEERSFAVSDVVRLQLGLTIESIDALGTIERIEWTGAVGRAAANSGTPLLRLHYDTLARSDSDELYHGACAIAACSGGSADHAWRRHSHLETRARVPRRRPASCRPHCRAPDGHHSRPAGRGRCSWKGSLACAPGGHEDSLGRIPRRKELECRRQCRCMTLHDCVSREQSCPSA